MLLYKHYCTIVYHSSHAGTNLDPALIGLSVAYIFSLTDGFSFSVRITTDIENYVRKSRLHYNCIILMNNGSTDHSITVIDDFC